MAEQPLPPQPKPGEFVINDKFEEAAYKRALSTWETICARITEANRKTASDRAFWGGQ